MLVINARPEDEAGIGDELGIMGVRDPGFRILTYEMSVKERYGSEALLWLTCSEELYRGGGLYSVTSKILVTDLLSGFESPAATDHPQRAPYRSI